MRAVTLQDHRFQMAIEVAGRTVVQLGGALESCGALWRVAPVAGSAQIALHSPVLGYGDLGAVQQIVRAVRGVGARVDGETSIELRIDAARFDARSTRNLQSIVGKQSELLARVLGRSLDTIGFVRARSAHFPKGAIALSLKSTLHGGEVAAAIVLALSIAERALVARAASARPRPFDETSARYDFRCFLLRLGLIGEEFRDAREQLLKRLPGNAAWRQGRPHRDARSALAASDPSKIENAEGHRRLGAEPHLSTGRATHSRYD